MSEIRASLHLVKADRPVPRTFGKYATLEFADFTIWVGKDPIEASFVVDVLRNVVSELEDMIYQQIQKGDY